MISEITVLVLGGEVLGLSEILEVICSNLLVDHLVLHHEGR